MTEATVKERQSDAGRDAVIRRLLKGAIDLHCHSGPSVMPRRLDHLEAMREASEVGMRALLFKDHYYSVTPVTEMLNKHFKELNVELFSGVPLNNTVGGFNRYAVDHGIKLGARLVWMPTFSSKNHIDHHAKDADFDKKFPTTKEKMLAPTPLTVTDEAGKVKDEVSFILELIAEHDLVLSSGHLHISEIFPLFERAKELGVRRLLVNHPTYVIDATIDDVRKLAGMGAYIEHSICMFIEGSSYKFYDAETLSSLIEAAGVDRTILGSDLGQIRNPTPVQGFSAVIGTCLDIGLSEEDIRKMISRNPAQLIGLDVE